MKMRTAFTFALLLSCALALAADGLAPVGFIRLSIAGAPVGSSAKTLISPSFVSPNAWSGFVASIHGTQLAGAGASWTPSEYAGAYYVEITSGAYAGLWTDIIDNQAGTLTTNDDLSGLVAPGDGLTIRKFVTLQDFLGADNRAGLKSATSQAGADEVVIYEGSHPRIYWYYDGSQGGAPGWYNANFQPAGTVIIPPGQGVVVQRKAAESLSVVAMGTVKRGPTYVAVQAANNVIDSLSPAGLKLHDSNLFTDNPATGVQTGNSPAAADEVVLYPASLSPKVFWRYDGSQGGAPGWYDTSYRPADDIEIPAGSSFAIRRKNGASFFWIAPSLVP